MRIFAVAGLIVLGVFLLISGLDGPGPLSSRLTGMFTGSPMNSSVWLFTGGALAVFAGVYLAYCRRPRQA